MRSSEEIFIPQLLDTYIEPIINGEIPSIPFEVDLSTPTRK